MYVADVLDPLAELVKRRHDPVVVQTVRSTAAAAIAYVVALKLSKEPAPLTAPLTALLVVQVTLYATLTRSLQRVQAVVVGVLIAIGFSLLVGLTWWSLALIILAAQTAGYLTRVGDWVQEVAISAMLVLGVTQVTTYAWDRVLETLIGAGVGMAFNFFLAPPVWVETAGQSIEDLARRMRQLMLHIAEELGSQVAVDRAAARLHEARRLDHDIAQVDAALRQAEDSVRLNPRVKEGLLYRVVLRTGLDTLEICTVILRVMTRSLTDLAKKRTEEPLFPPEVAEALTGLFTHLAAAVESFAVLVTTQVTANAEEAESRLASELVKAHASRDRAADLLLYRVQEHPRQWQLHGALLAEIDRILDELDMEQRSMRLMEELDRSTREKRERFRTLHRIQRWVRGDPTDGSTMT
ncbi:FUSC family protein [Streptomyces hygroscopicus]|uniref:FUSC family protein n=1 Tax=Streptomyces hygroscopicus TaxID=1912 RepID=UPI00076793EF|nr:FUSC family protein [Streptomyces hygroscopicus subsp. hygroscopicus]